MGSALWYQALVCLLVVTFLAFSYLRGKADEKGEHVPCRYRPTLEALVVAGSTLALVMSAVARDWSFHLFDQPGFFLGVLVNILGAVLLVLSVGLITAGTGYILCKPARDISNLWYALAIPKWAEYLKTLVQMDQDE
jgi:hypothetical protein